MERDKLESNASHIDINMSWMKKYSLLSILSLWLAMINTESIPMHFTLSLMMGIYVKTR